MSDPSSHSNPHLFKTHHVDLNWLVDFEKKCLIGHADLSMQALEDNSSTLILDCDNITINSILVNGASTKFSLTPGKAGKVEVFGSALNISLPTLKKNEKFAVHIDYETTNPCSALQWMDPPQTMGKVHPFMYSQCQAINVRSILPCQDTPSDKWTYTAKVSVKSPLVVLMSAVESEDKSENAEDGTTTYFYEQKIPIPSYLLAIVAGSLESRDLGPRSRVWSEKEMVEAAAWEFAKTEEMLQVAEKLAGPYVWRRYDLLVLPPTFPFGGMENPCLTFVTPALVAGDRSLTHVVAHEISHSWTGNLVTNQTWEDFWLNEGYTRFLERKIITAMYGEKNRQFHALGGLKDLQDSINAFGATNPLTNLVPKLDGVHPDDAFSRVPYEKGFTLLYYLEQLLGGGDVFEPFLLSYIDHFKYKSLTTSEWKTYLYQYFHNKQELLDSVDWNAWFNSPGMPPVIPEYDDSMMTSCTQLCQRWCRSETGSEFSSDDLSEMSTKQKFEFLGELLQSEKLISPALYARMDECYQFSSYKNVEIQCRWLQLGLKCRATSAIQPAIQFAVTQGREKYVRPMYRLLGGWEESREQTVKAFKENYPFMHPITGGNVKKDLKLV